jgi:hypothetical protein
VDHQSIHLRFQNVGRSVADIRVESVDAEEQVIGMQILKHALGLRTNHGTRSGPQNPAADDLSDALGFS